MVAVYPLNQIDTPELTEAAVKFMDARGPGAMGWSWSWKIALRARLGDGDTARELFTEAVRPVQHRPDLYAPVDGTRWGGLLPNLFSTHPPFQMGKLRPDGRHSGTARAKPRRRRAGAARVACRLAGRQRAWAALSRRSRRGHRLGEGEADHPHRAAGQRRPDDWVLISYGGRDLRTTIADEEVFTC